MKEFKDYSNKAEHDIPTLSKQIKSNYFAKFQTGGYISRLLVNMNLKHFLT